MTNPHSTSYSIRSDDKLTFVQKTVQKALLKVGANNFAQLPFPSHMHSPLLDILSWILVNDRIDMSIEFEQINEEECKKYQQNIDHLVKYGLLEAEGNMVIPGNYLIEIESRGTSYHERLSKALSRLSQNSTTKKYSMRSPF